MPPETRRALAIFLAEHAARKHAVRFPRIRSAKNSATWYVAAARSPDAYLFAVIDRAIQAEMSKLRKG